MYILNYNTGAGNDEFETLEAAMESVNPAYTQQNIDIRREDGEVVAIMTWVSGEYDADDDSIAPFCYFGDFGYYLDWVIL